MNYKENEDYIGLDELDARLFDCADVLRGSVDKGRYKDFVLSLVFYATVNGWYKRELETILTLNAVELTTETYLSEWLGLKVFLSFF